MRSVMRVMGGLARFFYRLIATPILFGWMIGAMAFGVMLGVVIGGVVAMSALGGPLGTSVWEWVIIGPPAFIGAVFGFRYWRMASGAAGYPASAHPGPALCSGAKAALLRRPRVQGAVCAAGSIIRKEVEHVRPTRLPCPPR